MKEKWKRYLNTNLLEHIPPTSLGFKIVLISSIALTLSFFFWDYISANHEKIRNIGLVSAALIGFPMIIWRTRIADRQTETSEASHIADVYTKAIEQLGAKDNEGNPHLELRLGGLYALERIAKSNKDYHPQIMEVLCAYIRMRSRQLVSSETPTENITNDPSGVFDERPLQFEAPETDIQAIMMVIGRRNSDFDSSIILNLSQTQLAGYNLRGVSLTNTNLSHANLNGACLSRADLSGVNLSYADLNEADLTGANLNGAHLSRANLVQADLRGAHLSGADLSNASLLIANLSGANLNGAILHIADLSGADLREAKVKGASIGGVKQEEQYKKLLNMKQQQEVGHSTEVQ